MSKTRCGRTLTNTGSRSCAKRSPPRRSIDMRELVLVHGRSQQEKDSIALKKEWLDTLKEGLGKSGLQLPIPEDRVRFPYYGDTLAQLVAGRADVAEVIVRGPAGEADPDMQRFVAE